TVHTPRLRQLHRAKIGRRGNGISRPHAPANSASAYSAPAAKTVYADCCRTIPARDVNGAIDPAAVAPPYPINSIDRFADSFTLKFGAQPWGGLRAQPQRRQSRTSLLTLLEDFEPWRPKKAANPNRD